MRNLVDGRLYLDLLMLILILATVNGAYTVDTLITSADPNRTIKVAAVDALNPTSAIIGHSSIDDSKTLPVK